MLDLSDVRRYGNIELLARQLVEGFITGLHQSPFHGFSVEFAEHRLYNTGESTRHMDWKVFAKTDRLYTKRYEEETNLRCHLLLDASASMYYPVPGYGKITFGIMAAAALAYLLQKQRDVVALTTFSEDIDVQTPMKSTATHIHEIFLRLQHLLAQPPATHRTDVPGVLHRMAGQMHRRSLVVLLSDMFGQQDRLPELFAALHHLRHQRHEVLLFHITDRRTEADFSFENRPYEFIDLETSQRLRLHPAEVQQHYRQQMQAYEQELRLRCSQYRIDFVEADIARGFDPVLSAWLAKRARMR